MNHMYNRALGWMLFVLASVAITAGCASFEWQSKPAAVPEIRPGILAGYQPAYRFRLL